MIRVKISVMSEIQAEYFRNEWLYLSIVYRRGEPEPTTRRYREGRKRADEIEDLLARCGYPLDRLAWQETGQWRMSR